MRVPTVKVKADNPRGFKIINLADFDAAAHTLVQANDRAPAPVTPDMEDQPPLDLDSKLALIRAMDRDGLKGHLDREGVNYNKRLGEEKLREMAIAVAVNRDPAEG